MIPRTLALVASPLLAMLIAASPRDSAANDGRQGATASTPGDAPAFRPIEALSVEQVARELRAGVLLVDLRETEERLAHGVIPGAIHVPSGMLKAWADPESPVHRKEFVPGRRLILHCAVGGRSASATAMLLGMGYERVAHLDGGFSAWRKAGQPIESLKPAPSPASSRGSAAR